MNVLAQRNQDMSETRYIRPYTSYLFHMLLHSLNKNIPRKRTASRLRLLLDVTSRALGRDTKIMFRQG